jgi:oligo-1,6-glucosidase
MIIHKILKLQTREWDGKKMLVMLNFSDKNAEVKTRVDSTKIKMVMDNYSSENESKNKFVLRPYEALIYELL